MFEKYKGIIISLVVGGIIGFSGSASGYVSQEEYNKVVSQNQNIQQQIETLETSLKKESKEVEVLKEEKLKKDELIRIAKEAEEKAALEKANAEIAKKEEVRVREKAESKSNSSYSSSNTSNWSRDLSNSTEKRGQMVWLPATGEKYRIRNNCGRMNPSRARQVTIGDAQSQGFGACKKCF